MAKTSNKDKIVVENLYKVFGPEPERAFELLEAGKSRDQILKEGRFMQVGTSQDIISDPTVTRDRLLHEVYDECSTGLPIAVVDGDGKLEDVVNPLAVFAVLAAGEEDEEAASAAQRVASEAAGQPEAQEVA